MTDPKSQYKAELQANAEGLPFKVIDLPEFAEADYDPGSVRQERRYVRPEAGQRAISRFLLERGIVELLKPEQTLALFTEIYWCANRVRGLADKPSRAATLKDHVVSSRRLISRMEAAEEEIFIANRRLIAASVKPYYWVGQIWLADFLQDGSKALSNAIRKFDFTRGTPFYAYAQRAIQNRLRNVFRDHMRSGALGIHPTQEMLKLKGILDKWAETHDKPPPLEVIAELTGIAEERIKRIRPLLRHWESMPSPPVSLDALVGDSTTDWHELVEDGHAEQAYEAAEKSEVWAAAQYLPERSQKILEMRFLKGCTLEETGQALNLTRARIKQIQDEALRKLKRILEKGPRGTTIQGLYPGIHKW